MSLLQLTDDVLAAYKRTDITPINGVYWDEEAASKKSWHCCALTAAYIINEGMPEFELDDANTCLLEWARDLYGVSSDTLNGFISGFDGGSLADPFSRDDIPYIGGFIAGATLRHHYGLPRHP